MEKLIKNHGQKIRFLLAGIWNTIIGYGIFIGLYYLFSRHIHYMLIMVVSNIFSITNAFISYRLFVFKSKGNILQEYLRFNMIYAFAFGTNLIILPILVEGFGFHPVISQGLTLFITFIFSYFGHKHFSFKAR